MRALSAATVAAAGLEDIGGAGDVHLDRGHRTRQRIAGVGHPGQVEHRVEVTRRLDHRRQIQHVDVPVRDVRPLRGTHIEHDHVVAGGHHPTSHAGSDEPRAAGDADSSHLGYDPSASAIILSYVPSTFDA